MRPLFIEHDAAALAALTGAPRPACDGILLRHQAPDQVLAVTLRDNPLAPDWLIDTDLPSDRIVAWSGTLSEELFERHPTTWLRPGREAFESFCRDIAPQLQRHQRRLCFQPHSRHVLSDPQSCVQFLHEHEGGPFDIALAPASMMEPAMLDSIEDHWQRMFDALGERCAMAMLSDVRLADDGESCEPAPPGQGRMPSSLVHRLLEACIPPRIPVVIQSQRVEQQIRWLSGAG